MTNNIAKWLKLKIDTSERYDLKGIAIVLIESFSIARNVPVYFTSKCTIHSDFAVIKNYFEKLMLILPNTLLDKYNYDLLISKQELRLKYNSKEFFIPVNMHKIKNKLKVNCMHIISDCDDFSISDKILQDLQNSQDLTKDKTLKKNAWTMRSLKKSSIMLLNLKRSSINCMRNC